MSRQKIKESWSSRDILFGAIWASFLKLDPRVQFKTPVMFVAYVAAIVVTVYTILGIGSEHFAFNLQLSIWLWLTVLFANFSGAIAEGRGKAQAASLKTAQSQIQARRLNGETETIVAATSLAPGDLVVCSAGDVIPADGEVVEGIATVDESAITGESAPVIRESGSDLSAVTAGTRVISDEIKIRVTSEIGHTFFDRMIKLIEGAERHKTPNEIALNIVLSSLTFIFLLSVLSVWAFAGFSSRQNIEHGPVQYVTVPVLVALLVCLIPTTIGALLHAIGIAGMDRLIRKNVIAKSGRCVEAAGDIDLLMVDKTGTITLGNRMASDFIPAPGYTQEQCAQIAQLASLSDETPEGRSIVILAKKLFDMRAQELSEWTIEVVPFSAQNKMSGINFLDASGNIVRRVRKGAVNAIKEHVLNSGGFFPEELQYEVERISKSGGTPLLVSDNDKVIGLVHLKDVVKGGIKNRFADMRKMGIRTLMITGDNALTAAAIAAEAGVDDFIAEATPEMKLNRIREEQYGGHLIAMTGDGTNDAPALAQADVGVAMSSGTQASREAGNMVDLDNDPTKILSVVEVGKQLLMTRGALTTFSIANDIAKYFAILPAMFSGYYAGKEVLGPLSSLNIMNLASPSSAILSTVIFNALIILTLIPLALRGAAYLRTSADRMLKHNLLVYGLGGLIAPFIGIKCIDTLISLLGLL